MLPVPIWYWHYGPMKRVLKEPRPSSISGGSPVISNFPEALPKAKSFKNLFEIGLKHEKAVTKSIHKMYEVALKEKDYAAVNFLNWFVEEQVEEEDQFNTILGKIKLIEEHGGSIYMLDRELAMRAAK
jgi:ferritin